MKSRKFSIVVAGLAIAMVAGAFTGCGKKADQGGNSTQTPTNKELSGNITASGSTALQPLAEQAAKKFSDENPGVNISIQGGGSGTGITQVLQGAVDIGNSDIFAEEKLKPEEAKTLVDHKVAAVGFAVVVNSKVKVDNLSKENLIKIFTGKVTNWKEVGGDDMKIQLVNRPKSSGTRATFKKYGLDSQEEAEGTALQEDSSGAVKKAVETTDGAISYLAVPYLSEEVKKTIKVLKVDNVEANKENITSGKYGIWSYEHMYTKGEQNEVVKAFLDYMVGSDAKAVIDKLNYIPISDMKVSR